MRIKYFCMFPVGLYTYSILEFIVEMSFKDAGSYFVFTVQLKINIYNIFGWF